MKIIVVVGPTASGKTSLGIELAKEFGGEIISADSMQIYKGMPVATAVPTKEEQEGIPHHLLEFLSVDNPFSVHDYVKFANEKAFEINSRGKLPIVVGGTGLFVDSFVNNIRFTENATDEKLKAELEEKSTEELFEMLKSIDADSANKIHPNNRKRVIRAIELYKTTGETIETQNQKSKTEKSPFEPLYIGINYKDRQKLYDRINKRVDIMVSNGLVDEALANRSIEKKTAKQAIGHKELEPYFNGEITFDDAIENLKRETRRYAKRQLTWFRRNENINWLYADEMENESQLYSKANELAKEFLKG